MLSRLSQRLYRLLVRLYPAAFVEEYGGELERQFRDDLGDERRPPRLWMDTMTDLFLTLPREHAAELSRNLRYALRLLHKTPALSLTVVATLALGIASVSTVFAFVNAILLHPFSVYRDPDRLVMVWATHPQKGLTRQRASYPEFQDWVAQNDIFDYPVAFGEGMVNLTGASDPEMVQVYVTSPGLFRLLGVEAARGRTFLPEEEERYARVAVIRHSLWVRHFHSDPGIAGRKVMVQGVPHTVVGVTPPGFRFFNRAAEIFLPTMRDPQFVQVRFVRHCNVMARLKRGVSLEQAQARMDVIARREAQQHPESAGWAVRVVPLKEDATANVRRLLLMLLVAVALVLLIAGANCGSLLLVRAASRSRELSVRLALGAGRARLVRQLVTESVLLAVIGCALALPLAWAAVRLLLGLIPDRSSFGKFLTELDAVRIDGSVLACALALSVVAGIVFGMAPALAAARVRLLDHLKEAGRGLAGDNGSRIRRLVVPMEVAAAVVLTIGAGLLIESFLRLLSVDPGFRSRRVVTATAYIPMRYNTVEKQREFYTRLLDRIARAPGIERAAATSTVPLLEDNYQALTFRMENRPAPAPSETPQGVVRVVTPEYFDTLGIPLHSGRWFTARDAAATPRVLIVNEALARRYWHGENPVGRRITLVFTKVPYEIIGVVGNTPAERLDEDAKPAIYFAFDQFPTPLMSLLVRSPRDPADVASLLRAATREIDRDVALYRIFTMDSVVSDSVWQSRFSMLLLSGLAGLAVVLASVGLYGVLRYTVAQRAHEIGIRVALGASRSDVLRLVIGGAMRPALAGIAMGLLAALALTQLMSGLLYGVTARDAKTFVAAPVLLITLALTAAWFPARKAAAADPMGALRAE